jgi:drug/metabolite transporter (DMT)-like permease
MGKVLLSKMYILKFAEPFFACIFGAIMLKENIFTLQYLFAFILIITGVIIGIKSKPKKGTV